MFLQDVEQEFEELSTVTDDQELINFLQRARAESIWSNASAENVAEIYNRKLSISFNSGDNGHDDLNEKLDLSIGSRKTTIFEINLESLDRKVSFASTSNRNIRTDSTVVNRKMAIVPPFNRKSSTASALNRKFSTDSTAFNRKMSTTPPFSDRKISIVSQLERKMSTVSPFDRNMAPHDRKISNISTYNRKASASVLNRKTSTASALNRKISTYLSEDFGDYQPDENNNNGDNSIEEGSSCSIRSLLTAYPT